MAVQILVKDKHGEVKAQTEGSTQAVLVWEGEYEKGDSILFNISETEQFYVVRVDDTMDKAIVYLTKQIIQYEIPFDEKKNSYNPKAFTGTTHYLMICMAENYQTNVYRNLSKNVMDQHGDHGCFPHTWANVETRGESVFAARNAIDGIVATQSHGPWPYQSWGINRQEDAQITVEFGRLVEIDRVVLYLRADFPHDNWWEQITLTVSDGTSFEWNLKKSGEAQVLMLPKTRTHWVRMEKMIKSKDPSPFPALTQIEVYGTEVFQ